MRIQALGEEHLDTFFEWHKDSDFDINMSLVPWVKSIRDICEMYAKYFDHPNFCLICTSDANEVLCAFFAEANLIHRSAEVHITTSPINKAGLRYAGLTLTEGLKILFNGYGLEMVFTRAIEGNKAANKAAGHYGFHFSGMLRRCTMVNGVAHGLAYYDMMRSEFENICNKKER